MTNNALTVLSPGSALAKLDDEKQKLLSQLPPAQLQVVARMDLDVLAVLPVEDFQDYVAAALAGAQADEETPYIPGVFKPVHASQVWQDDTEQLIGKELKVVIVHHHPTRAVFNEGEKMPLCSSLDGKTGKARPDAGPDFPWGQTGDGIRNCTDPRPGHGCPWDAFHTASNGDGKRCGQKQRLFALHGDRVLPVLINVPTTSLVGFRRYISSLKNMKALTTVSMVETHIKLIKGEKPGQVFSIMEFVAGRRLEPTEFLAVNRMSKKIVEAARRLGVEVGETYDEVHQEETDDPF